MQDEKKTFLKTQFDVFDIYSIGFETVGLKFMRFLLHFINLLDILKKKKYLSIQITQAKLLTCFGVILNSEDKQIPKLYLNLHFN